MALDVILMGVLAVMFLSGLRQKLLKSAIELVGELTAVVVAGVLGGSVASWLFRAFFYEAFEQRISEMLASAAIGLGAESVLAALPDFLVRSIERAGITTEQISALLETQQGAAVDLICSTVEPVLVGILKVLAFIILFMIVVIISRIVADVFEKAHKLPIPDVADSVGGGVLRIISAIVVIWVIFGVFNVFLPLMSDQVQILVRNYIQESILLSAIYNHNWIEGLVL